MKAFTNKNYVMRGSYGSRELEKYHLIFCPSYACNLACKHCYLPSHSKKGLNSSDAKKILFQWSEIVKAERGRFNGIFHIKGGEPLFLPYLYDLFDALIEADTCSLMITTNGTLGDEAFYSKLLELDKKLEKTTTIIVSLDGSNEEVHALLRGSKNFAKTVSFVSRLVDIGINVHLNYVVHRKNLNDLEKFVGLAISLGVNQINFLKFNPKGFGESINDWNIDRDTYSRRMLEIYESASHMGKLILAGNLGDIVYREQTGTCTSCECVGGYKGLLYVIPNGNTFPCPNLLQNGMCLGNIYRDSLSKIHAERIDEVYYRIKGNHLKYQCKGENLYLPYHSNASVAEDHGDSISYCYSRNF